MRGALGGAVLALLASHCILVVPDDLPESGEHCLFEGSESQCGACVAASCQLELDACCSDVACDATFAELEGCATAHDARCEQLRSGVSALSTCVQDHCGGVCIALTGVSTTRCEEPAFAEGAACRCSVTDTPNDEVCSRAAYAGTICCAPTGWPAVGLGCSCKPLGCNASPDGCFCSLVDYAPEQRECTSLACCVDDGVCACRPDCYAFETEVPACTADVTGCADGQIQVESCSLRTPP
jgi:hypothetical protein